GRARRRNICPGRARGARSRPPASRHQGGRGRGAGARARRPGNRARRLPDLESPHRSGALARRAPTSAAPRRGRPLLDLDRRPGASASARGEFSAAEQAMFFPKLRRQAKWMFVFLVLVFGLGFLVFGIGTGGGLSLQDFLKGQSSSSGPSAGDARDKIAKN